MILDPGWFERVEVSSGGQLNLGGESRGLQAHLDVSLA